MPWTLPSNCRKPGCTRVAVERGMCALHAAQFAPHDLKEAVPKRYVTAKWWHLYNSAAWKGMRRTQLLEHPLCFECAHNGVLTQATEADHIEPHRGDPELFFAPGNLQSLCKRCHSRKTNDELRLQRALCIQSASSNHGESNERDK